MKEMLGENNKDGIVTENDENALYEGIKTLLDHYKNTIRSLLDNPDLLAHYKGKAKERGKLFSAKKTVVAVEDMLVNL